MFGGSDGIFGLALEKVGKIEGMTYVSVFTPGMILYRLVLVSRRVDSI